MNFARVADTWVGVAATPSRAAKTRLLAELLGEALRAADGAAQPGPAGLVAGYLSGQLRQRRTGLGWRSVGGSVGAARPPHRGTPLTVAEVDAAFAAAAGAAGTGAAQHRRQVWEELLARAGDAEAGLLRALATGEVRHGAGESLVAEALARAAGLAVADVRRAAMLAGGLAPVADAIAAGRGLGHLTLTVGQAVQPMLAASAPDVAAALARTGPAGVEVKLDGVRVQVHRHGDDVWVFTRSLDDITGRAGEVEAAVRALPARSLIVDGEAVAFGTDGRPRPFQVTASRMASRQSSTTAVSLLLFDLLHLDGVDLMERPARERIERLRALAPGLAVPRLETGDPAQAQQFLQAALAAGHEGVVVKSLSAPYEAGRRGAAWQKVKPVLTLDLVVLAVEPGSGRRRGWLSNLHLGALAEAGDPQAGFVMLGKTFKGLTDAVLRWQTEQLQARAVDGPQGPGAGRVLRVRPELVVEVAIDGVQRSTRYPGGVTLRFARVVRYRPDKTAAQADSIDTVRALLPADPTPGAPAGATMPP